MRNKFQVRESVTSEHVWECEIQQRNQPKVQRYAGPVILLQLLRQVQGLSCQYHTSELVGDGEVGAEVAGITENCRRTVTIVSQRAHINVLTNDGVVIPIPNIRYSDFVSPEQDVKPRCQRVLCKAINMKNKGM